MTASPAFARDSNALMHDSSCARLPVPSTASATPPTIKIRTGFFPPMSPLLTPHAASQKGGKRASDPEF